MAKNMFCLKCTAEVTADDQFCPKCGDILRPPRAGETPPPHVGRNTAAVLDLQSEQGPRVESLRLPLAEAGTKYTGLTTAADVMINSASVIRILSYVMAGLSAVSVLIWLHPQTLLGILVAILTAALISFLGWSSWLALTVLGEFMYVIIDVEENLRRRVK